MSGLTSSLDAGQDEPERFYPSGKRNVRAPAARRPGAGRRAGRADALARRAQRLRARRPGPVPDAARRRSSPATRRRPGSTSRPTTASRSTAGTVYSGEVEKIARKRRAGRVLRRRAAPEAPRAVAGSCTRPTRTCCCSARARWRTRRSPRSSARPAPSTYLTTPILPDALVPAGGAARARRLPAALRRRSRARTCSTATRRCASCSTRSARAGIARQRPRRRSIARLLRAPATATPCSGATRSKPTAKRTLSRYGVDRVARRSRGLLPRDRHARRRSPAGPARAGGAQPRGAGVQARPRA